jgi:hypothetical protein
MRGRPQSIYDLEKRLGKPLPSLGVPDLSTPGVLQELQLMSVRRAIESAEYERGADRAPIAPGDRRSR